MQGWGAHGNPGVQSEIFASGRTPARGSQAALRCVVTAVQCCHRASQGEALGHRAGTWGPRMEPAPRLTSLPPRPSAPLPRLPPTRFCAGSCSVLSCRVTWSSTGTVWRPFFVVVVPSVCVYSQTLASCRSSVPGGAFPLLTEAVFSHGVLVTLLGVSLPGEGHALFELGCFVLSLSLSEPL